MEIALGFPTAGVAVLVITFAFIRFGGFTRRIGFRVFYLGLIRAIMAFIAAAIVFGGTELLPGWDEPFSRGLASAIAGYGLNPGLPKLVSLGPLTRLVNAIDTEIRETNAWDDPWLLRRDAERLGRSFTPRCVLEIYEHNLAFIIKLDPAVVRDRAAVLRKLLDDSVAPGLQIGPLLRQIKTWGSAGWPANQTVEGFIVSMRSHGYRRLWRNRCRRLTFRTPLLIERSSEVIA